MNPRAKFFPLRQSPHDETRPSVEMLNMDRNHEVKSGSQQQWKSIERKPTFREKLAHFPWKPFFVVLLLPLALTPIVVLAAVAEVTSQSYIRGRDCYPNGLWKEATDATWRIMDSSYFFTPNLSFGAMTFTQVKVIDIAWDLIVGRGGQVLLAWVNYRVFNEWLVYHMEMHFTSYKMYAAIAFETTTMGTVGVLAKELLAGSDGTWKRFFHWLAILSMFLSTFYVLSFPTLLAAMTGYITTSEPYVRNDEGNLVKFYQVQPVRYVVEDASRVGLNHMSITAYERDLIESVENYIASIGGVLQLDQLAKSDAWLNAGDAHYFANVSTKWEFRGSSYNLEPPSLQITRYKENLQLEIPPVNERHQYAYSFGASETWSLPYPAQYLLDNGSCKPSETYQWGFSYIFLFMVSIFNFIWACIMVVMWLDTRRGSRMYKSGRRPGLLRSIIDYSAAIRAEIGTEVEYLEEEQLRKRVRDSGGALVVPKTELRVARADTGVVRVRKRSWKRSLTRGSTF